MRVNLEMELLPPNVKPHRATLTLWFWTHNQPIPSTLPTTQHKSHWYQQHNILRTTTHLSKTQQAKTSRISAQEIYKTYSEQIRSRNDHTLLKILIEHCMHAAMPLTLLTPLTYPLLQQPLWQCNGDCLQNASFVWHYGFLSFFYGWHRRVEPLGWSGNLKVLGGFEDENFRRGFDCSLCFVGIANCFLIVFGNDWTNISM